MNAGFPLTEFRKYCLCIRTSCLSDYGFVLLNEDVKPFQWFGIVLIIAIIIMNVNFKRKQLEV
jgi:drug/metabolite transporter (DMT)-like permease